MTSSVTLNAEQEEIRSVARRFLGSRYGSERLRAAIADPSGDGADAWREVADLGWLGIAVAEEHGGAGYGIVERCLLLEEMGGALAPAWFLASAVLAADALAAVASAPASELLAAVADGSKRVALVAGGDLGASADIAGGVAATVDGSTASLEGDGGATLGAPLADVLVVAARTGSGVGLLAIDLPADGVAIEDHRTVDETRRFGRVRFDGAVASVLAEDVGPQLETARWHSAIGLSAELVGGARRCLDMTLAYVKDRKQFGVPVGSFQAIKHRIADLTVAVDAAREAVYFAADVAAAGDDAHLVAAAAMAKATASEMGVLMAEETIQLHGGIGFTWEHDAHLYYKRALVGAAQLGVVVDQRERLAVELGV